MYLLSGYISCQSCH